MCPTFYLHACWIAHLLVRSSLFCNLQMLWARMNFNELLQIATIDFAHAILIRWHYCIISVDSHKIRQMPTGIDLVWSSTICCSTQKKINTLSELKVFLRWMKSIKSFTIESRTLSLCRIRNQFDSFVYLSWQFDDVLHGIYDSITFCRSFSLKWTLVSFLCTAL